MKTLFYTVLLLSLVSVQLLYGQITGNINVRDQKALVITEVIRESLCGKKWTAVRVVEIRKGIREEFDRFGSVEFGCDGKVNYNMTTWDVVNEQFLKVTNKSNPNLRHLLNGAYAVYAISDSTLVLGQILTSTGDWTREYTFSRFPKSSVTARPSYWGDSLKDGKQIKYFPNGHVSSIQSYRIIKQKISAEDLFLGHHTLYPEWYDLDDSTQMRSVPVGDWVYYHPDGQVQARYSYDQSGNQVGKSVRFLSDGRLSDTETFHDNSRRYFMDHYEYTTGEARPVIKRVFSNGEVVFVLGNMDSVQVDRMDFYELRPVGSYVEERIHFVNLTSRTIPISAPPNAAFDTKAVQIQLGPYDTVSLSFRIKIPAGSVAERIQLKSSEWEFGLGVRSFGYHLSSSDFDGAAKRTFPTRIFFYRTSDEYQLEIRSSSKQRYIPVSKTINEVELRKGQYQFTLIGPSGRKTIDVVIE